MMCPARATALAVIILLILILLFYKALVIANIEPFQAIAACQNFSTKEGCNENPSCIWCRFRGQCVQKGQYRECIEPNGQEQLYQVSAGAPPKKPITLSKPPAFL
jgi:hypothetical protein